MKSHELLAEDQLVHLKSYRYQAVDKSFISRYILKHYVFPPPPSLSTGVGAHTHLGRFF